MLLDVATPHLIGPGARATPLPDPVLHPRIVAAWDLSTEGGARYRAEIQVLAGPEPTHALLLYVPGAPRCSLRYTFTARDHRAAFDGTMPLLVLLVLGDLPFDPEGDSAGEAAWNAAIARTTEMLFEGHGSIAAATFAPPRGPLRIRADQLLAITEQRAPHADGPFTATRVEEALVRVLQELRDRYAHEVAAVHAVGSTAAGAWSSRALPPGGLPLLVVTHRPLPPAQETEITDSVFVPVADLTGVNLVPRFHTPAAGKPSALLDAGPRTVLLLEPAPTLPAGA